jgi:ribosome-binding factor A
MATYDRTNKAVSNLMHLAQEYIAREAGRTTLITPMRAVISPNRINATIFVSVFPESEKDNAVAFLTRHKDLFRDYLKKHGRFNVLPFIRWEFDYGEQNRQRLDELSKEVGTIPTEATEETVAETEESNPE